MTYKYDFIYDKLGKFKVLQEIRYYYFKQSKSCIFNYIT